MIQFPVASLNDNSQDGEIWQGLNAASVALQQAAQSETAVYQVFSEQLVKLGFHGSVNLLDESGKVFRIARMVFSEPLMRLISRAEKIIKISSEDYTYPVDASPADAVVLAKGDIVFLSDNTEKMKQVLPPIVFRYASPLMKPFLNMPAVLAPIFFKKDVVGVLYVAGDKLKVEDVPAIAAFATHLSIALENARLFQAMQQAEAQYRTLFESANDGIFLFDPETNSILSANPKMQTLSGFAESELRNLRPSQLIPPEIYQAYANQFEVALRKGRHFFEVPFVDRAGKMHQWQISTTLVEVDGKPILNGVVRDITKAKQAEVALRQREEQFRVLAENVPGTIYLVKNQRNFPLLYINEGVEALTGFPKEKFIRQEIFYSDLIHLEDRESSGILLDGIHIGQGERFQFVYRIRHRSGNWHWVEDVGSAVYDEQGNVLFLEGIISDITERVESDLLQNTLYRIAQVANTDISLRELYASIHQTLAHILDVSNFYIALYDEVHDTIDIPYFVDKFDIRSGKYQAGTGLTELVIHSNRSQLLTKQQIEEQITQGNIVLRGAMPQVWLGVPLRTYDKAVGALVVQSYEKSTAYTEQDQQFLIFVSEQIAHAIERKQLEERQHILSVELKQQTRLLQAILAATPDNFLVFDLDGRFMFISNAILEYLQVDVDFVVGKTWQELNLPRKFGELSDQDRAAVLQTGQAVSREFIYPMPDGDREIEFVTNPVLGPDGETTAFVTTSRDVTERKQTMRAMYRAQKMESLGVLAGGIAHDFNNLLVAMLGQASLAQARLTETDPAYTHVGKAVQAAEQAAGLTRQLLAYSGGGQFMIQTVLLNDLIGDSADLLKVALPKQVQLQLNLTPELPQIEGDVAQIQQVLMNLIINAAEAIGEQAGTIWLETAVCQIGQQDRHFWRYTDHPLPTQQYVKLSVQDSGEGMNEETQPKIFDPFFTTKFTGRGLGLAAVLGIIRGHKGGLHVKSSPGQGTTFELLFPIAANSAEISVEEPEKVEMNSKGLILVIDDEKAVREAVTDILEMEEIDVLTAANGDEGIKLYKAHSDEISLILLDLSMPGKSGHETFEELSAIDPHVRILLSSGYSEDLAIRGFASPPLVGFLQKPYRLDTFINRLSKYL
ncbi:PAS domain S-box protein [Candidatus Leptofilum sp.]|uniref:PAS domain S-box protein n=1 Tax=Candidatus Leptofilum sp. TaxID=3241576 RepID=UPI003B5BEDAA